MKNKVSIIVPMYNAQDYIERCLKTIINQTYKNIEILIINDGSIDSSIRIVEKYAKEDSRIRIIDRKNSGVSISRNVGIELASGEYIMFIDSDDWIEVDIVEKLLKKIQEKNVDALRCNYYRNYSDGTQLKGEVYNDDVKNMILNRKQILDKIIGKVVNGDIPAYVWLLIIKKEILEKVKPFNENLAMMEDTIFYLNMLFSIDSFYIYDKPLYHYYCNFNSASKSKKNYLRNFQNILLVNELEIQILKDNNVTKLEMYDELNIAHARMIEDICYHLFKENNKIYVLNVLKSISENERCSKIIENANLKRLILNKRLAVKYLKNKKINKLYNYYKIVNSMSKIKTFILKRKE